jgi:hypothetical protein
MIPNYKRILEIVSNGLFEEEIKLLFGEGSKIKINNCYFSTQKKAYLIDTTIEVSLINESSEAFPSGLEFIISDSWEFMNVDVPIIILSSIDTIKTNRSLIR